MTEAGAIHDRPLFVDRGVERRLATGAALYAWCALAPFLPTENLTEPAFWAVSRIWPATLYGLALWAFVDHSRKRRWAAALILTPVLTFIQFIATGVAAMAFSFLASGQMPL